MVTLFRVRYFRLLLPSRLTLLGSESKSHLLGGQTVLNNINAIDKRSPPIPRNMPERKTILNVSHVCISGLSLSLVNVEVSSDLALWSTSRQLVRHIPLSGHPVSGLTFTLDMRDLEPQRSLGAQTWRKVDAWDGDGIVRWVPGCTGRANCAARRAQR